MSDPVFDENEFYIHTPWTAKATAVVGEAYGRTMHVSPADGSVKCTWTLDEKVISNDIKMVWNFNQPGTYNITFTAQRGDEVKSRVGTITVQAAN